MSHTIVTHYFTLQFQSCSRSALVYLRFMHFSSKLLLVSDKNRQEKTFSEVWVCHPNTEWMFLCSFVQDKHFLRPFEELLIVKIYLNCKFIGTGLMVNKSKFVIKRFVLPAEWNYQNIKWTNFCESFSVDIWDQHHPYSFHNSLHGFIGLLCFHESSSK